MTGKCTSAHPGAGYNCLMVKSRRYLLLLLLAMLAACTSIPEPAAEISVTFKNNFFIKTTWWVFAGQEITIRFENQDPVDHEFIILYRSFTAPFSEDEERSTYWRHKVPAGGKETVTFRSPAMPANYPVYCLTEGNLDQGITGKLTVVSPATSRP